MRRAPRSSRSWTRWPRPRRPPPRRWRPRASGRPSWTSCASRSRRRARWRGRAISTTTASGRRRPGTARRGARGDARRPPPRSCHTAEELLLIPAACRARLARRALRTFVGGPGRRRGRSPTGRSRRTATGSGRPSGRRSPGCGVARARPSGDPCRRARRLRHDQHLPRGLRAPGADRAHRLGVVQQIAAGPPKTVPDGTLHVARARYVPPNLRFARDAWAHGVAARSGVRRARRARRGGRAARERAHQRRRHRRARASAARGGAAVRPASRRRTRGRRRRCRPAATTPRGCGSPPRRPAATALGPGRGRALAVRGSGLTRRALGPGVELRRGCAHDDRRSCRPGAARARRARRPDVAVGPARRSGATVRRPACRDDARQAARPAPRALGHPAARPDARHAAGDPLRDAPRRAARASGCPAGATRSTRRHGRSRNA